MVELCVFGIYVHVEQTLPAMLRTPPLSTIRKLRDTGRAKTEGNKMLTKQDEKSGVRRHKQIRVQENPSVNYMRREKVCSTFQPFDAFWRATGVLAKFEFREGGNGLLSRTRRSCATKMCKSNDFETFASNRHSKTTHHCSL